MTIGARFGWAPSSRTIVGTPFAADAYVFSALLPSFVVGVLPSAWLDYVSLAQLLGSHRCQSGPRVWTYVCPATTLRPACVLRITTVHAPLP